MDNNPLLDSDMDAGNGLSLSNDARFFLHEAARWAKFLAILGFIGAGFLVLVGLGAIAMSSALSSEFSALGFSPVFIGFLYLIIAVVYLFPSLFMYNFANRAQGAVRSNSSSLLTEGMGFLRSTFRFYGIAAIVFIAVYLLFLLFLMVSGGAVMGWGTI
jgi:hypothetical protein